MSFETLTPSRGRFAWFGLTLALVSTLALAQSGPTPFTYVERTGVATNALVTSEAKTVTGFIGTLPVSVSGEGNPQYKVGAGAFTSTPGTILAGQTLTMRHTSSVHAATATISTVTVGDYSTPFKSVTGAGDRTPDPFDFGTILNTFPDSFVESAPQTLADFNTAIAIVPGPNAQYRINSGAWTNAGGTLSPGQVLQMRHLTSSTELAYTQTYLTVGGVRGNFTTRNRSNTNQPPIADAGADQVVDAGSQVTLDGTGSTDAENPAALGYAWVQVDGPDVALQDTNAKVATFTAPDVTEDATLAFELTVTDDAGKTASDTVEVTVLAPRVLSIADAEAGESAGSIEFKVSVTPAAAKTLTVQFATADETAHDGADFIGGAGTLVLPAGATEATIVIPVIGDDYDENDETFTVGLAESAGAVIGEGLATGTIRDDDDKGLLRVGAAKRSVTPTQEQIDGIDEPRLDGTTHKQRFNLGGFGIDPLQNIPDDPFGGVDQAGEALTEAAGERAFTGSHGREDIHVRVMVVEQADGARIAFVMLDAIGAGNLVQKAVKEAINAAACDMDACFAPAGSKGEEIGNIVFGQTHSHAGPDLQGLWGGVPQDWVQHKLVDGAADAAREALGRLLPAHVTFRQGSTVEFNNYRRPRYDTEADADGALTLLTATGDDGTPVGSLLQYNAHPTSVDEDPRVPHADYIQGAMDWLESPATGAGGVALYYNGPIADASGSDGSTPCNRVPSDGEYGHVRCRGEGIASTAQGFAAQELDPTLAIRHVEVTLPITNPGFLAFGLTGTFNRYYDFMMLPADQIPGVGPLVQAQMLNLPQLTPVAKTLVSRITLGGAASGLEIVTIPGEATNTFGQYIRGLTANKHMMLLGLTHNSFGYIIPEEEFNYIDPSGDAGLVAPFTGYEENVSLGPLTAPLLRFEAYHPLFDVPQDDPRNVPPVLAACQDDPMSENCVLNNIGARLEYIQHAYANQCRGVGGPEEFCQLFDPQTPLYDMCKEQGFPEETCRIFGAPGAGGGGGNPDAELVSAAADMAVRGCDMLDPSYCLFPFPNDHFTAPAAAGSPQSVAAGGTGKRVAFNIAAMPRNAAGKPIDPTEWNRNDGFSPGQMIVTYVPGIGTVKDAAGKPTGPLKSGSAITDLSQSIADDASIFVLDVTEGTPEYGTKQLAWAEIDLNAGMLLHVPATDDTGVETPDTVVASPKPQKPALIIRPAKNFLEGHRYAVVLRNLQRDDGSIIPAGTAFAACLDEDFSSALPPVAERCQHLRDKVFPAIESAADVDLDPATLFLAWDFTVASTQNDVSRLRHMRDDAFASLGDAGTLAAGDAGFPQGSAPTFTISSVKDNPSDTTARQVKGTFTVPSYLVPADDVALPAPLNALSNQASLPPNRLFYQPDPAASSACGAEQGAALASCLEQARYGDGLPDRNPAGDLVANFTCNIPKAALSGKDFATATAADIRKARPSLYGHGLLGSHTEGGIGSGSGQAPSFGNEQDVMICATDWYGFASGDLPNVASTLADLSQFPVVPDASQQGVLNFLFLARLMSHPDGFAGRPEFQLAGTPVFDTREVFYDGNSQGGILGGPVVAMSRDIQRGVLGVPGMNYSTLLTRSVDFDLYSVPLYAAYPDDLDRSFIFSMMQMLWDRSENNGYAQHITHSAALNAPDNEILLHPSFGDHQVSTWTAEVMARTIGARVDRTRVSSAQHPDENEYVGLSMLDYADPAQIGGSAFVIWNSGDTRLNPPIGNQPPYAGNDPHSFPRGQVVGRCQKGHFLQRAGLLIEVPASDAARGSFVCPALTGSGDVDADGDGVSDETDNCPSDANANQANADGDAQGDACDADDDNDGVEDGSDACPLTAGEPSNNGCPVQQPDGDADGVPDASDNCPADANAGQEDNDGDGAGDACDADDDNDGVEDGADNCPTQAGPSSNNGCPAQPAEEAGYGTGVIGVIAELAADLNEVLTSMIDGDFDGAQTAFEDAVADAQENVEQIGEAGTPGEVIGTDEEPQDVLVRAASANRDVEAVVLTGAQLPGWSAPAALGVAKPYPSGAGQYFDSGDQACGELPDDEAPFPTGPFPKSLRGFCEAYLASGLGNVHGEDVWTDQVRNAYNGTMLWPTGWTPGQAPVAGGVPVGEVAAFRWTGTAFEEIPVQVDERKPYFLANANSGFSFYSGTDEELSYAWDTESWGMTKGECEKAYDPAGWDTAAPQADRNTGISRAIPDPVAGIDNDDEIVFMAADAGALGPTSGFDASWKAVQIVRLNDALDPAAERVVYLVQKAGGPTAGRRYVNYTRDADADQWIDRSFFADSDPLKLGTSNTGYGPNLHGTVCKDGATVASTDRFPRDGVTVATDTYRWQASGRWMVRDIRVRQPDASNPDPAYWQSRPDLVDRWKGRAFQQSPDSTVSLVGFEDEQVNWEANSSLLGERCGPVRCMREVWGADSGTNVTKTETFYRDVVTYRYHVRVHPIPPDGLYTSWDYNRSAMVDPATPGAEGRYFTVLRPQGVPIDGQNDDVGQVDSVGGFPGFFDTSDPTFNLPLAFDNWEQISGKDDLGSLVYLFELKGPTSLLTPAVVPYYRDDACLDDGTGDDPVQRPYPGEATGDSRVKDGYAAAAGKPYDQLACTDKQGAHAQHGVHYFFTSDVDNATQPKAINEVDGQQWQFMVPTDRPHNVAEPYANIVRTPLVATVVPLTPPSGGGGQSLPDYETCVAMAQQGGAADHEAAAKFACAVIFGGGRGEGEDGAGQIQGPNTYIPMADGTLIAANVYVPWGCNVAKNPDAKSCPSILEMSGYESGSDEGQTPAGDLDDVLREETGQGGLPLTSGTRGAHGKYYTSEERYVSVTASVRGTGCSAGEFDVFSRKSAEDGKYLIDHWMAQQSWSNGKVGIFGHSYSGITGAMIASTAPEHLKVVSVSGQIGDIYRDITYPGGVSNYGFPLLWTAGVRPAYDYLGGSFAGLISDSADRQCLQNQAARSRTTDDPLIVGLTDTDTPWMQQRSVVNYLYQVNAPTHITTAYQDEQTGPRGGTHVFDRLPQDLTRRLVTLNGDHGTQTGPAEVTAERRWWLDRFLLDANDPNPNRRPRAWGSSTEEPPTHDALALPAPRFADDGTATSRVLLEVHPADGDGDGDTEQLSNGHIDSTGFPLAQTQWTDFYFQAAGALDTALPTIHEGEEGASSSYFSGSKRQLYSYQAGKDEGGELSSADANGADELVFALDVDDVAQDYVDTDGNAQRAFVIAGPITARLFLSATGGDTEMMVQLIDADPATGERLYLQRGVLKASHRAIESQRSQCAAFPSGGRITNRDCTPADNIYRPYRPHVDPETILPGVINEYRLEVFPVGHVLRAGHQLLVKVHAPALDDNDWAYIQKTPPGINTLHHSAEMPSSIRLPVIPVADVSRLGGPTGTCTDNEMRCVIAGGVADPTAEYRGQCREYGDQLDPGMAELVCGLFDTIAENVFGATGGGGGSSPGNDIGEVTGPVLNAAGSGIEGMLGTDGATAGRVLAGVGVVDMTPDMGYSSGQHGTDGNSVLNSFDGGTDPYLTGKKQEAAQGVQSRMTGRAIVIEGSNGKRIALLKSDNYLAQDHLVRRIGQLLAEQGSSIGYDQILYGVTHDHSSPYYSTPSAGVWVFQDVYDPRFMEFQARRLAQAIRIAELGLKPARLGATTVHHKVYKGNVTGTQRADDGTPAGYPRDYGDHGLVVMRIETDEAQPQPIAVWVNWGQHPEGLGEHNLQSSDYVSHLERFVEREIGAPLVFSQGDVGSSENSGNKNQRIADDGHVCEGPGATGEGCAAGEGVWRDWYHTGFAQGERGGRFLADAVVKGWKVIGGELPPDAPVMGALPNNYVADVQVPLSDSFPVDFRNAWVPGPLSHPFPGVSACRTETTAEGNPGVPNAADCTRPSGSDSKAQMIWETLKEHGAPLPENYELPAFGTVEENLRLKLQAFRIGDIVLGSCACEAQVDLILNFESRANDVAGDIYDGFDWACVIDGLKDDPQYAQACATQKQHYDPAEFSYDLAPHGGATNREAADIAHMRAQVHNPADGWDAPEYVPYANAEPADPEAIKGNFTKEELPAAHGYKLAIGLGHAGDYNGYTVSYREYMAYDHYRKELTAYGAHTADYMVTRLVRMAGAMKGAPEMRSEPLDTAAQADEARQVAASTALGQLAKSQYEAGFAALPPDVGPAVATTQPADIGTFAAATFSWRGGSTQTDNPRVAVQRCKAEAVCADGDPVDSANWEFFADQTGEVQMRVQWPTADEVPSVYAGQFEWQWTANFEAFEAFPVRLGSTPPGTYRFAIEGCINDLANAPQASMTTRAMNFLAGILPGALAEAAGIEAEACHGGASKYALASEAFEVQAQRELVSAVTSDADGTLTITVAPTSIPKSYDSSFTYITPVNDNGRYCRDCSFRPWATSTSPVVAVTVTLAATGESIEATGSGATWTGDVGLADGASATITARYADGTVSRAFAYTRQGSQEPPPPEDTGSNAPQLCAPDGTPEIEGECLSDNGGEPIQQAVDTVYSTITGLPIPKP